MDFIEENIADFSHGFRSSLDKLCTCRTSTVDLTFNRLDMIVCYDKASLLNKNPLKSYEFIQGKFRRVACLIHQIFMAKTKGIFMGLTYKNTIKKAMKIL